MTGPKTPTGSLIVGRKAVVPFLKFAFLVAPNEFSSFGGELTATSLSEVSGLLDNRAFLNFSDLGEAP